MTKRWKCYINFTIFSLPFDMFVRSHFELSAREFNKRFQSPFVGYLHYATLYILSLYFSEDKTDVQKSIFYGIDGNCVFHMNLSSAMTFGNINFLHFEFQTIVENDSRVASYISAWKRMKLTQFRLHYRFSYVQLEKKLISCKIHTLSPKSNLKSYSMFTSKSLQVSKTSSQFNSTLCLKLFLRFLTHCQIFGAFMCVHLMKFKRGDEGVVLPWSAKWSWQHVLKVRFWLSILSITYVVLLKSVSVVGIRGGGRGEINYLM